jgi:hypothetical protein
MTKIVVDRVVWERLASVKEPVQLCDEQGRVFGCFTPAAEQPPFEWGRPQISEEELQRRAQGQGGRTLAEILADLEKRA